MNLPKIKISPSALENFRSFKEEKFEGTEYQMTAEKLIASIKGERKYAIALTKGKALHTLLEHGTEGYLLENGGCSVTTEDNEVVEFGKYTRRVVDRYRELNPDMIHEIPLHLTMNVSGYEVRSNMRLDGLNPYLDVPKIHDHKTSSKAWGQVTEYQYYDSVQWRMYLMACTDVDIFQYDIFHFQDNNPQATREIEYYNFQFNREIDMEQVVGDWMMGYIKFCEQHSLIQFITLKSK
jgi:hypothetical protein